MKSMVGFASTFLVGTLFLSGCAGLNLPNFENILDNELPLTESTVADGLREALSVGTGRTVSVLSVEGGFSANTLLRIALPEELTTVGSRLRSLGFGREVDQFELRMNEAAEQAAGEALDVFSRSIRSMSIADAFGILNGPQNAATLYFKDKTSIELTNRFEPVVRNAMQEVGVYTVYTELISRYNAIPLVRPVTVDLEAYIVDRTLTGMFSVLEGEEQRIREDPLARTTELLRRVFSTRD